MPSWTIRQQEAIDKRNCSLLVSAAAGSGKTAVLIERIKKLIIADGISLDNMLIVTFTKAAASEMKERLRNDLSKEISSEGISPEKAKMLRREISLLSRADISTFDSFAQRLVKKYYQLIGVNPNLKVCDNYKSSLLKTEAMDEMFKDLYDKEDEDFIYFLDRYSSPKNDINARNLIEDFYNFAITLPDPKGFISNAALNIDALYSFAAEEAADLIDKGISYAKGLERLLDIENMPKLKAKVSNDISSLTDIQRCFENSEYDTAFSMIASFKFSVLTPCKEEKASKAANEDKIKELWDDGCKKVLKSAKEKFGEVSKTALNEEQKQLARPLSCLSKFTLNFADRYAKKKAKLALMDFSDGEHFAIEILKNNEVRSECRNKYKCIFVDEYQDSNPVQDSLIEAVSSGNNIFLVGDVKQSIYKFRFASPELFLDKYKRYKSGNVADSEVIDLNSNFRSKAGVIDFVNRLFSRLMTTASCNMVYDSDAALVEGAEYRGEYIYPAKLYIADYSENLEDSLDNNEEEELKKEEMEAIMAASIIKEYKGKIFVDKSGKERALEYGDMAILLRSTKVKAEIFYEALTKSNIPAYLERNEGYFDTVEIQLFLNLLKILDNFKQDIPLISVLYFKGFGFSAEELACIRLTAKAAGLSKASFAEAFLYVCRNSSDELAEKCNDFYNKIKNWRIKAKSCKLSDFVWTLLYESNVISFAMGLSAGEQRLANLRALADKASEFEQNNAGGLSAFVSYIESISGDNEKVSTGQSSVVSEGDNVVRIMTIHKSKGLEFPFVLVSSCGSRIRGNGKKSRAAYHKELGCSMVVSNPNNFSYGKPSSFKLIRAKEEKEDMAEEIRVLYVAATRARDFLVFSAATRKLDKLIAKRNILSFNPGESNSFLEMIYPSFEADDVTIVCRDKLDTSIFETAKEDIDKLKYELENGFDIDESKLILSRKEIEYRLNFDYSADKIQGKTKYSVSELSNKGQKYISTDYSAPSFLSDKNLTSAGLGTAYHTIMEHIPFTEEYSDLEKVKSFIESQKAKGIISEAESAAIDPGKIHNFFISSLGKKIISASELHKETPFVIKHQMDEREVLVQGVIDCWFVEEGKLYLLDYKSNKININKLEEEKERLKAEYTEQLKLYKEALELISGKTLEAAYLYLLSVGEFLPLNLSI